MKNVFQKERLNTYNPRIQRASKVTVTSLGVIFKEGYPIFDTIYRYPKAMLKAPLIGYASCLKRGVKKVECSTMPAFVHSQWSRGYYHWITESLPRAIAINAKAPEATIFLPPSYNSFHPDSLNVLGIKYKYFPWHNIFVDRAIISSCPMYFSTTKSDLILDLRERLIKRTTSKMSVGERIYVSRRNARGRKVANEHEVIEVIKSYGFSVVEPERYSFEKQISIFSNARFLVGIHGAGLSNMMFMRGGGGVMELLPFRNGIADLRPNNLSFKHDNCYVNLARCLGLEYRYLECAHDKVWYQRTNLANIHVDCGELAALLDDFMARPTSSE